MTPWVRERIVHFGPQQGLSGILSTSRGARDDVPHVVIVNAGIIHRVGPSRLHVDVARALVPMGYSVLRFDLAGLGDSQAAADGALSLDDSAVRDLSAAFDYLAASRHAKQFLVFGLCSGAEHAALIAAGEPRVVGVMLVDPPMVRTPRGLALHIMQRLLRWSTLRALLTLRHGIYRQALNSVFGSAPSPNTEVNGQPAESAAALTRRARSAAVADATETLQRLLDRGVQFMMVFTGNHDGVYNYRNQLFDLLPRVDFRDQLRLEYMPETDHSVSDVAGREQLLAALREWMQQRFTPATPPDAADAEPGAPIVSAARAMGAP